MHMEEHRYSRLGLGTRRECKRLGRENVKDIIACGFDVTKTFIFSDYAYVGG
ncbi:unnamed protein product [Brassica napus]|uniref:Tryptophanyl-tRNA synthetase n=1 Tax=Brassica napus TaxID=3708 RepID=A0A816RPD1_BRANA|nr:unnamed protein product [Brassica napus]